MSPVVSPLDVPALVVLGMLSAYAYRRTLCRHNEDWFAFAHLLVAVFWLDVLAVWAVGGQPWLVLPAVRTDSLVLAAVYPLSYPLWFRWGAGVVFLFLGRRPEQGGVLWVYTIGDDTDSFDPSWDD